MDLSPAIVAVAVFLAGCSTSSKLLDEPDNVVVTRPIVEATHGRLAVALDLVVVPGGPGSWAKNAAWDEYRVRVANRGDTPLDVHEIVLVDALSEAVYPGHRRKALAEATREVESRYEASNELVRSAAHGGWMIAGGVAMGATGVLAGAAATSAALMSGTAAASGATAIATGGLLVGAVMIGAGVVRMVRNSRVDDEIVRRASRVPVVIAPGETRALSIFFPVTPLPRRLHLFHADGRSTLDVSGVLAGAHVKPP